MIDSEKIEDLIKRRKAFTIGTRGICIKCRPIHNLNRWEISVPRAFVYLNVKDLAILDDEDNYDLCYALDDRAVFYSFADLTQYDKLKEDYQ